MQLINKKAIILKILKIYEFNNSKTKNYLI